MIMSRIEEKGETFVAAEKQRLVNILKTKLTDKKKQELTQRLNVLESFRRQNSSAEKSEL
jgi:Endoplasmic reticulum protein ERp29, C-terminal domain